MNTRTRDATRPPRISAAPAIADAAKLTLQIQEVILALVGEYVPPGGSVWSGGMVRLLEELGFTAGAARIALNRVVKRGLLAPSKDGRRVHYHVTSKLSDVLTEGHRQTFWFRYPTDQWDGRWTLVWYAIPEELVVARRRLSRRLSFLGFGALQDGTWLAPGDRQAEVRSALIEGDIEQYLFVLVGEAQAWLSTEQVLEQGWNLAELNARYVAFVEQFGQYEHRTTRTRLSPRDSFVVRTQVLEVFRQLAPLEPKVPDDSLRSASERRRAIECLNRVDEALRAPAADFVATITDYRVVG